MRQEKQLKKKKLAEYTAKGQRETKNMIKSKDFLNFYRKRKQKFLSGNYEINSRQLGKDRILQM